MRANPLRQSAQNQNAEQHFVFTQQFRASEQLFQVCALALLQSSESSSFNGPTEGGGAMSKVKMSATIALLGAVLFSNFVSNSAWSAASDSRISSDPTVFISPREMRQRGFRNTAELHRYLEIVQISVSEEGLTVPPSFLAANGYDFKTAGHEATPAGSSGSSSTGGGASSAGNLADEIIAASLGDVRAWITLGMKLWNLVSNNRAVVQVSTQSTSVVPSGLSDWSQMETWKGPLAKSYVVSAKNTFGVTVVSHTYTVAYNYGGSYKGKGQFIGNATIIPSNIEVSWGFKLESNVAVGQPLNTGTYDSPVPAVDLTLLWKMSSLLKHIEGRDQFNLRGDGVSTHTTMF